MRGYIFSSSAIRVTLLFSALTLPLAYPLSVRPGTTALPGDADTNLFIWTLAWDAHALGTAPLSIFDANIYYPQRRTLAYSENLIGSALVAAPVLRVTGNPVLALNTVALLSVVLCGLGAYFLSRRLGASRHAAVLCGIVFAFSPARFFRIGQLHLTTVQWMPFALGFLHSYLDGNRARDLRLGLACFSLQALTSGHGAVFLAVAMGLLVVYRLALGEPLDLGRRLRDVGVQGALLLLPAAAIAIPYRLVQVEMGLRRSLENWATTPESFIASPARVHVAISSLVTGADSMETASAFLFPGYLPLVLAVAAVASIFRRSLPDREGLVSGWRGRLRTSPAAFYALLTVLTACLAAGPPIGLWPLVYWLPGFNFVRVPSRFVILGVLGLAVLAGIGFDRLTSRFRADARRNWAIALGMLLLVECAVVPLPVVPYRVEIPAADRWLAGRPRPFVVAEAPVTTSDRLQSIYMLHSTAHWQKTVHGHSGLRAPEHEELYHEMRYFPDEESLDHLQRLRVDYVVVHTAFYRPGEWPEVERRLAAFQSRLTLEYDDGAARVYAIRPR